MRKLALARWIRRIGLVLVAALVSLIALTPPPAAAAPTNPQEATLTDDQKIEILTQWTIKRYQQSLAGFCWKGGYDRGGGTGIDSCPDGFEKNGLLCYPLCRPGFVGNGPVCWQTCQPGWIDDGAFCRFNGKMESKPKPHTEYGRGVGYGYDEAKCNRENGQGCEKSGDYWYPKCRAGWHAFGCCICTPDCEPGWVDDGAFCRFGGSVPKQSYGRGAGTAMTCAPGKVNEGGLCYTPCQPGYTGSTKSCLRDCPPSQKETCGPLACAIDHDTCTDVVAQQISTSVNVLVNAAKFFAGGSLASGSNKLHVALAKGIDQAALQIGKNIVQSIAFTIAKKLAVVALELGKFVRGEIVDLVVDQASTRMASTVLAKGAPDADVREFMMKLDPTGIAQVVQAFDKPPCMNQFEQPPMFAHVYDQVVGAAYAGNREHIDVLVDRGARADFKYWGASVNTDSANLTPGLRFGGTAGMVFNPTRSHVDVWGRGEDGALNLYSVAGSWQLTPGVAGARVAVQSDMAVVYEPQRKDSAVFFRGEDGYVHYVYRNGASWAHDAVSFRAIQVNGSIAAVFDPIANHSTVVFRGTDNRIHRYFVSGGAWQHEKVGATNESNGSVTAAWEPTQRVLWVAHRNVDDTIETAFQNPYVTGGWDGGPRDFLSTKVTGDIQMVFPPGSAKMEVVFKGEDGVLHHWGFRGGKWVHTGVGSYGGAVQGHIVAAWSPKKQGLEVVFVGKDKQGHYDFLKDTTWSHETF